MNTPRRATQTCPPTSARRPHPSYEHRPLFRPVRASASAIHDDDDDDDGIALELPSTFHAWMGSSMRTTSPMKGGMDGCQASSSAVRYNSARDRIEIEDARTPARARDACADDGDACGELFNI